MNTTPPPPPPPTRNIFGYEDYNPEPPPQMYFYFRKNGSTAFLPMQSLGVLPMLRRAFSTFDIPAAVPYIIPYADNAECVGWVFPDGSFLVGVHSGNKNKIDAYNQRIVDTHDQRRGGTKNKKKHGCRTKRRKTSRRSTGKK